MHQLRSQLLQRIDSSQLLEIIIARPTMKKWMLRRNPQEPKWKCRQLPQSSWTTPPLLSPTHRRHTTAPNQTLWTRRQSSWAVNRWSVLILSRQGQSIAKKARQRSSRSSSVPTQLISAVVLQQTTSIRWHQAFQSNSNKCFYQARRACLRWPKWALVWAISSFRSQPHVAVLWNRICACCTQLMRTITIIAIQFSRIQNSTSFQIKPHPPRIRLR